MPEYFEGVVVDAMGNALSGMHAAADWQATSAHNIANLDTNGFQAQEPVLQEGSDGGVRDVGLTQTGPEDLVTDTTGLMLSSASFQANIVSARTAEDTYKDILKLGEPRE